MNALNNNNGIDLDQALARAGDGVFVIGQDGKVVLWNRAAERILGHSAREAVGRPCAEIFGGRDDKGNRLCYQGCHVMTLIRIGEAVQNFDMATRTKTGQPVWLNISILSVPTARGNHALMVHLFRDVTASRELLRLVQDRLTTPAEVSDPTNVSGTLTRRELEVLRLMASGANTKAAGERLHVSPATIRNHAQNIFGKLGVHSRLEAVAYATRHRLL
jgi:PAS domain S-box-containing protein